MKLCIFQRFRGLHQSRSWIWRNWTAKIQFQNRFYFSSTNDARAEKIGECGQEMWIHSSRLCNFWSKIFFCKFFIMYFFLQIQFVRNQRTLSGSLVDGFRHIIHDSLIEFLSTSSKRFGKKNRVGAVEFSVFTDCLFDACFDLQPSLVEEDLKRAITKGHNRIKTKKYEERAKRRK